MAVTVLQDFGTVSDDDVVARQRKEHMAKVYDKAEYRNETVTIDFGTKGQKEKVVLKFEPGSSFAFAVYQENATWHERGREEWAAAATDALEKFCAVRDVQILMGPRPEITNRYNLFVEVRGRIE